MIPHTRHEKQAEMQISLSELEGAAGEDPSMADEGLLEADAVQVDLAEVRAVERNDTPTFIRTRSHFA